MALRVHGFVSQGFLISTHNHYLPNSKRGSFEFTEVGINFTKPLTDELRLGIQLFARDFGTIGNYDVKADWFYADYRFGDWLGLRVGRVKIPFGLYNEVNDVDAARVPILLPQSVYPIDNRDYLLAQTGGELYGYAPLGGAGALDYRVYGGTIFLEPDTTPGTPYEIVELNVPYVLGGRMLWETPLPGLRAGGSAQWLRLDLDLLFDPMVWMPLQTAGMLAADFSGLVEARVPALLWVGSIEYAAEGLTVAAEYSRWHVELESGAPVLLPEDAITSERMYLLVAYRVNGWFEPSIYYALRFPEVDTRSGRENQQHDLALTARFDVNRYWLIKLEGHYLHGTAELSPELNDGTPLDELDADWAMFIVKTTAYF